LSDTASTVARSGGTTTWAAITESSSSASPSSQPVLRTPVRTKRRRAQSRLHRGGRSRREGTPSFRFSRGSDRELSLCLLPPRAGVLIDRFPPDCRPPPILDPSLNGRSPSLPLRFNRSKPKALYPHRLLRMITHQRPPPSRSTTPLLLPSFTRPLPPPLRPRPMASASEPTSTSTADPLRTSSRRLLPLARPTPERFAGFSSLPPLPASPLPAAKVSPALASSDSRSPPSPSTSPLPATPISLPNELGSPGIRTLPEIGPGSSRVLSSTAKDAPLDSNSYADL
jgi:hypothetical protein